MYNQMITLKNYEEYLNGQDVPDSLFADVTLPTHGILDKPTLVKKLLRECGSMIPIEDTPDDEKEVITDFFNENYNVIDRYVSALEIVYNPLENYNRTDEETYDQGRESETITHYGKRHTESVNGRNTNTHIEGLVTTTEVEGLVTTTEVEGLVTNTEVEGRTTKESVLGSTSQTTEAYKGQTTQDVTKPNSVVETQAFKGFSTGSSMTDGMRTTTSVGNGNTYMETTTTHMDSNDKDSTTVTTTQDDEHPTVETHQGDSENPTVRTTSGDSENPTVRTTTGDSLNPTVRTTAGDILHPTTDVSEGNSLLPSTMDVGHAVGENDTVTVNRNKRTFRAFGNIGVTTSQQMLESELLLAEKRVNVYNFITDLFKKGSVVIPIYM